MAIIKAVTKNRLKYKLILYFIFRADYAIKIKTIMLEKNDAICDFSRLI